MCGRGKGRERGLGSFGCTEKGQKEKEKKELECTKIIKSVRSAKEGRFF
jgi:hypothetical protein